MSSEICGRCGHRVHAAGPCTVSRLNGGPEPERCPCPTYIDARFYTNVQNAEIIKTLQVVAKLLEKQNAILQAATGVHPVERDGSPIIKLN